MPNPRTTIQESSIRASSSSVVNTGIRQNIRTKRCKPASRNASSKTKRTTKNSSPLSDITNITILESSPYSDYQGSSEINTSVSLESIPAITMNCQRSVQLPCLNMTPTSKSVATLVSSSNYCILGKTTSNALTVN